MTAGELTYIIYKLILKYLPKGYSYHNLSGCLGILESVKQEFYRRIVAPYEDEKIKENGDI
jgi:hypothetical protein